MGRRRAAAVPFGQLVDEFVDEVDRRLAEADRAALPPEPETPLWTPLPGPQTLAMLSPADELFYGGAGGGGKSDLLLGLAVTAHRRSIIFRSEFAQFRGADGIWMRSTEIVGGHGRSNGFNWFDLPGDRALEFGAANNAKNMQKYRGRPHDLKGYDELPEIPEQVYRFLNGWLRSRFDDQRKRIVGTGNPPSTDEGQWVIRYWGPWLDRSHARPAAPGELRWYAVVDGRETELPSADPVEISERGTTRLVHPKSRTFIPARVEDNPYYMATGYDQQLDALPEPLRSQMRYGDFGVSAEDDAWQVIPTAWVAAAMARWQPEAPGPVSVVGNDPSRGGGDEFVIAKNHAGWVAPLECHEGRAVPDGVVGAQVLFKSLGGNKALPVQIDIIGSAGSSVYDQAGQLGLRTVPMNGSERSEATDRSGKLGFANKRAEWHWHVREALDPASGLAIALPPDYQMKSDLCAPRWRPTPRGIQVEPKEDIKKRIGRSPDRGEAVIYALAAEYLAGKKKHQPVVVW